MCGTLAETANAGSHIDTNISAEANRHATKQQQQKTTTKKQQQ